jgi:hypothetical protein
LVTFPEIESKQILIRDPFQSTLGRIDQFACEFAGRKDEDVPVVALEPGKHQQAAQSGIPDGQSGFLIDFPDHTLFRRLAGLKLPAQPVPLPLVDIVGFFVAMDHKCAAIPFDIAQCGKDHGAHDITTLRFTGPRTKGLIRNFRDRCPDLGKGHGYPPLTAQPGEPTNCMFCGREKCVT